MTKFGVNSVNIKLGVKLQNEPKQGNKTNGVFKHIGAYKAEQKRETKTSKQLAAKYGTLSSWTKTSKQLAAKYGTLSTWTKNK